MPAVKNISGKSVELLRHRVLADSRVMDPKGKFLDHLPSSIAWTPQARRLVQGRALEIEGYAKAEPEDETQEETTVSEETEPETPAEEGQAASKLFDDSDRDESVEDDKDRWSR